MRTIRIASAFAAVTTGYLLVFPHHHVQAEDKPNPKAATIIFQDVPGQPPMVYDLMCIIELVGLPQKFPIKGSTSAGTPARQLGLTYNTSFEGDKGLQYKLSADETSLTIMGWKDPKTGKFYPIKKITFTSKTMPKAGMPKVTNPKLPAT
jgi:hypothetical protein